ncbi:MAG: Nitrous-oxide reductase [Acidimicrobiales bacterium]|nr:MAG: Sec-dependent nitrous-oxide reductase [Actinomycetota bacterium]MBV6509463.1 Nitrous-oxide reductase [Acidimicrobiales bacterium]RIK06778.1 MAG: Sec-dependent nitrous-oxide reductase [Acidobacteriota bacterium]
MKAAKKYWKGLVVVVAAMAMFAWACSSGNGTGSVGGSADEIIEERGLTDEDVAAAVSTYTPSGVLDEYVMFASGGHSGQVFVIGMPSMRLLKTIGVFTPEPWQGWGYGSVAQEEIFASGNAGGQDLAWADTHHPALSETEGDYDGEWLFINDKANARVATIDLRDFETKQFVKNPIALNDHGGTMVTPDTEWIIEGGQYAAPLGWEYAPLESYNDEYKGMVTLWKFDRESGRIDENASFALELPPYWQDLCDAGKLASDGWIVCNSFNTERATGVDPADPENTEPIEAGASANENDYLHVINLEKAAEVAANGGTTEVNGFPVVPLETSIDEGLLYFVPEPKSPHGADVTPDGEYIVVAGKLDPHVTIYSWDKILGAIEAGDLETDEYGVPIIPLDTAKEAQVELGLGPLHTQFDDQGYAYTSLFLDSAIARWKLGDWTLEGSIPVQYNIGHLAAAEGDTVSPDGKYVVALNKWSIDRFFHPGPLYPQNFQLIDVTNVDPDSDTNGMQLLYDMPIGMGEPHYAQIIKADKLEPWAVYPEVGWDPETQSVKADAPQAGNEGVVRDGNNVTVNMTAIRSHFAPERVEVNQGDHVTWNITNVDTSEDATHGFAMPGYNISLSLEPGETQTVEFDATQSGVFTYYCSEFCSALHLEMAGYFLVNSG